MKNPATSQRDASVASGLNLVLPLRKRESGPDDRPQQLARLMAYLEMRRPHTTAALQRLNFVHFARFLPATDGSTLSVITEFDGPLQPYVMDFIIVIGEEFSVILSYMEDWPEQRADGQPSVFVKDRPDEYWNYISRHNKVTVAGLPKFDNLHLFSAYPQQTVLDIIGPATEPDKDTERATDEAGVDLDDVQANLLRGTGACKALHLALQLGDPSSARRFIAAVTDGGQALPQVSNGGAWKEGVSPEYRMTIGFTFDGLVALELEESDLCRFPRVFKEGPAYWTRAAALGDHGASGPQNWVLGAPGQTVHMLVSLYGYQGKEPAFQAQVQALIDSLDSYTLQVVHQQAARVAANRREHFGYRDGISQPRVAGVPRSGFAGDDVQPEARAGEFLLGPGYRSVYGGFSIGRLKPELCTNASYAVVRLLAQDVKAFDLLLADGARASGQTEEWVAAKLMGRYRDGTPLSPSAVPVDSKANQQAKTNTFDYAPSERFPGLANDHKGLVCPIGAHVRRMNPRHARVTGEPHSHRVLRRGMPYGPTRAEDPSLEKERGLYAFFVCADIERQFEFLQREWANGDIAASGIRGTQDPIIGAQDLAGSPIGGAFRIPTTSGDLRLKLPRLVTTRGSLYLLMPGLAALKHLAALGSATPPQRLPPQPPALPLVNVSDWVRDKVLPGTARLNAQSFNPKDPEFLANPYPFYAVLLQQAPVLPVQYGEYKSLWIFGHKLVDQVCKGVDSDGSLYFHKPSQPARRLHPDPRDKPEARGLFYLDPPCHTEVRERLEPAVHQHFIDSGAASSVAQRRAREQLAHLKLKPGDSFDVVRGYTRPVMRDVLLHGLLGAPNPSDSHLWPQIGAIAETMLAHFDPMKPVQDQAEQLKIAPILVQLLVGLGAKCPADENAQGLWCDMVKGGVRAGGEGLKATPVDLLPPGFPNPEDRMILATAGNFVLAGFLSMDFLLGNALALLLADEGEAMEVYRAADDQGRADILAEVQRFDPPFQLADRVAAQDTILGGIAIKKGDMVTVCYGSANHDPVSFDNPDVFDVRRKANHKANTNWAFGQDHHRCIGYAVAVKVTQVVLDELIDAFPGLALDPLSRQARMTDAYLRGFASLTLRA